MRKSILFFLTVWIASAGGAELLYRVDFNSPEVKAAVKRCPFAEVTRDFEENEVLTVTVPVGEKDHDFVKTAVRIPLDFAAIKASGASVYLEGNLKFDWVTKPAKNYNGAKFMLTYRQDGKWHYPAVLNSVTGNSGSRNWFRAAANIPIGAGVKDGYLILGLQDASGEISFKDICFYHSGKAPVSTLSLKPIPQARYTGATPLLSRGVMSPNAYKVPPREEDFAELRKWNVNIIRWQLRIPKVENLAEFRKALEVPLAHLQAALDLGAKYGVKLLIDLHPMQKNINHVFNTQEGREFLVEFWRELVPHYRNHPGLWGYDILNEPNSRPMPPGSPSWPEIAGQVVKAIRELDPVTPIVVESDLMALPSQLEFLPVYDYPNIVYSIHMYEPGSLTHQLDRGRAPLQSYPSGNWNYQYLRNWLLGGREFQQKTGARILVGEFGCPRWVPGADRYLADLVAIFEEFGWDWVYHAFREWDGWSLEHSDDPLVAEPVKTNARKEVMLAGFRKNTILTGVGNE